MMKYVEDNERKGYVKTREQCKDNPQEQTLSCSLLDVALHGKCLGMYLKEQLWERDMKIQDLAARSGVTRRTISRIIHARCEPCNDTLYRIYAVLNIKPLEAEQSITRIMELEKENPESGLRK